MPLAKRIILTLSLSLFCLTACSKISKSSTPSLTETPTPTSTATSRPKPTPTEIPTATPLFSGYVEIPPRVCTAATLDAIRVETESDLMAWQPGQEVLAYIGSDKLAWFTGNLLLASAPGFEKPNVLTTGSAGSLAWSPSGKTLAFLTLRTGDNLYTITTIHSDGSGLQDWFPGKEAKTDDWSSPKGVERWLDESHLSINLTCGSGCLQPTVLNINDGSRQANGNPIQQALSIAVVHNSLPKNLPQTEVAKMALPNASPDGKLVAYLDEDGTLWVLDVISRDQSRIDLGKFTVLHELKWSFNSKFLAVRADGKIIILQMNCNR